MASVGCDKLAISGACAKVQLVPAVSFKVSCLSAAKYEQRPYWLPPCHWATCGVCLQCVQKQSLGLPRRCTRSWPQVTVVENGGLLQAQYSHDLAREGLRSDVYPAA